MINRVILVGRMTKDPELRRTASGDAVTSFTMALDRGFTSQDGQTADFIPVVVWKRIAENVAQYCGKGSLVGVEGRLRSRSYDNNHGDKVFVVEVLADRVQFLETRAMRAEKNQASNSNFYQPAQQQAQPNSYYGQRAQAQPDNFYQPAQQQAQPDNFYDQRTVNPTTDYDPGYRIMDDDLNY